MRIALVSTPRSGNTWLRQLLAKAYRLDQLAAHTPEEVRWADLPERLVLQLHWQYSPEFQSQLTRHAFRVVTISRHPLDTLISILQFSPNEPQTARWLDGVGGDERSIHGKTPSAPEFLAYCESRRAIALLSVTPGWWREPHACRVRYEDLVADRDAAFKKLAEQLGVPFPNSPQAFDEFNLANLRSTSTNGHFWQGQPGLWHDLFVAATVRRLEEKFRDIYECLGYSMMASADLESAKNSESIVADWNKLTRPAVANA